MKILTSSTFENFSSDYFKHKLQEEKNRVHAVFQKQITLKMNHTLTFQTKLRN